MSQTNPFQTESARLYNLTNRPRPEVTSGQVTPAELRDPARMRSFLDDYGRYMEAPNRKVAASRFLFHWLHPTLKGGLAMLLKTGRWLPLEGETNRVYERYEDQPAGYHWGMRLTNGTRLRAVEPDPDTLRDWWSVFLIEVLPPVLESLHRAGGCGRNILIENVWQVLMVRFHVWHNEDDAPGDLESRYRLLRDTVREVGSNRYPVVPEPEATVFTELRSDSHEPPYTRNTCCLHFRLEHYCDSCPLEES